MYAIQIKFGVQTLLTGEFVYMAAIIDWHSKAILSHKISNTMDSHLVTSVLEDALLQLKTLNIF